MPLLVFNNVIHNRQAVHTESYMYLNRPLAMIFDRGRGEGGCIRIPQALTSAHIGIWGILPQEVLKNLVV